MATHDYVIANDTGASVRADINSVLQAILTNNSSSSAPSTTAAYMFWADTTSGTLKIRNSSDNAWVELLQLDGTLTLEDGSASTPGLAFRDDLNTGIFSSAADTFNVATAGVERMELGATTIFNEDGADVDFRIEGDTEANLFYVDAGNNNIGIGTATPTAELDIERATGPVEVQLQSRDSSDCFISFGDNSDSDIGIIKYQHTDDSMRFTVNANERLRINSSGSVGIGTTTPETNLHVQGAGDGMVRITSADGSSAFLDLGDASDKDGGRIQYNTDSSLRFSTASTERIRIDSSGNVGIGTTSADKRLEVRAETATHQLVSINRAAGTAAAIFLGNNSSNNGLISVNNSDLLIGKDVSDSFTEHLRIDSSGRFLLGISSSITGGAFQVNNTFNTFFAASNDAQGCVLQLQKTRSTSPSSHTVLQDGDTIGRLEFKGATGSAPVIGAVIQAKVNGTPGSGNDLPTDLIFRMQPDGVGDTQEAMRIRADRTVEIATEGAIAGFSSSHVTGSGAPFKIYKSDGSTHAGLQLIWDHFNTTAGIKQKIQFTIGDDASSDGFNNAGFIAIEKANSWQSSSGRDSAMVFATTQDATESEAMRIRSDGNVGIGNSNPADKLVVDGGAITQKNTSTSITSSQLFFDNDTSGGQYRVRFDTNSSTVGSISVGTSSTAYNTSSDYRLKENIISISDGITRLKTLIPRRFNWKSDSSKTVDGFIAHEVTAVPEAVTGTKDEVATEDSREAKKGDPIYQQIDQAKLVPLLTAALQEAVAKLEVLETKVAALEAA